MKNLEAYRKIRKIWTINPRERIKENKKIYNRKLTKQQINKMLKQEDL